MTEYFTDEAGNLIESTVVNRTYTIEDLKMQLQMLQSDQSRVVSEIARLSNLLGQFDKVK
jgi:hypothetical protein